MFLEGRPPRFRTDPPRFYPPRPPRFWGAPPPLFHAIKGSTEDRAQKITKFRSKINAFLLSLKAGGDGFTLTEADTVLLIDPWWNSQAEKQAMDRTHRIGQTKTVNVYKLAAKKTIEEKMLEL